MFPVHPEFVHNLKWLFGYNERHFFVLIKVVLSIPISLLKTRRKNIPTVDTIDNTHQKNTFKNLQNPSCLSL